MQTNNIVIANLFIHFTIQAVVEKGRHNFVKLFNYILWRIFWIRILNFFYFLNTDYIFLRKYLNTEFFLVLYVKKYHNCDHIYRSKLQYIFHEKFLNCVVNGNI